jgi:ISXO2-like transposase domain/Transposase zinc-ribbon domain
MKLPSTLQEAIQHFSNYENCREFMVAVRWPDGKVRCPQCNSDKVSYLQNARLYKCYGDHPKPKFSLKVGTIFEDSPISLEKWLAAVWLIVNCKNGVSSYEIHRDLGVTQKSAWFMLHRIRLAMQSGSLAKLGGNDSGPVQADETFVGGKAKNMHKSRRARMGKMSFGNKTIVAGLLETKGQVRTQVIANRSTTTLHDVVKQHVEAGSHLSTDDFYGYWGLHKDYVHQIVNHAETYVSGNVHTNGIENFWALLKRGLHGTYISVEPFHLFRYLDEQCFRYNNRATKDNPLNDGDRFHLAMTQIVGKRLTYAELTGKTQERPL